MERVPISTFKAKCAELVEQVSRTGMSIVIIRHGKPVAEVTPPPAPQRAGSWLRCMEGTLEIVGDLDASVPVLDEEETVREWDELVKQSDERLRAARKRK